MDNSFSNTARILYLFCNLYNGRNYSYSLKKEVASAHRSLPVKLYDDLSQKVSRGMRRGLAEGKSSGTPKPGYIRTQDGSYQPDGKNFELMCEAWQMKLKRVGHREIAAYMNENGYGRKIKGTKGKRAGQTIKMDWRRFTDIFVDPFY